MRARFLLILPALFAVHNGGGAPPPRRQDASDSVALAIQRVGFAVAHVKTRMDLLRRAAGNDPDSSVLDRATELRAACEAMAGTAAAQSPLLCRHCLEQERQAPIDAYRAYLPSLERAGRHCATTIVQLRQSTGAGAARRLRHEAVPIGDQLVEAFVLYERHLYAVRVAFGWAPPASTAPARRGG